MDEENDEIEELFTFEDCEGSVEMYEAKTGRIASWLLFICFMAFFGSCVSCEYIARTHCQCEEGAGTQHGFRIWKRIK